MKRRVALASLMIALATVGNALAAERSVMLVIDNISCIAYAYEARNTIAAVPGVTGVELSISSGLALVTFDEAKTSLDAIIAASADAGFPARLAGQGS